MHRFLLTGLASIAVSTSLTAQEVPGAVIVPAPTAAVAPPEAAPKIVVIKRDTPLQLIAYREITTATSAVGSKFSMQVNQPLVVDGKKIIPYGTKAIGEVTSAEGSAALGKSGKMTAKILYLEFGGNQIPLDGDVSAKGTGSGSMVVPGLMAVATLNPFLLFHRGNSAKIKAGEIVTVFVGADVAFDVSGADPRMVRLPVSVVAPPAVTAPAGVVVK